MAQGVDYSFNYDPSDSAKQIHNSQAMQNNGYQNNMQNGMNQNNSMQNDMNQNYNNMQNGMNQNYNNMQNGMNQNCYSMQDSCNSQNDGNMQDASKQNNDDKKSTETEKSQDKDRRIQDYGQVTLEPNGKNAGKIHVMTIIGEIEGHDTLPATSKTTKYEHVLPQLASIEDDDEISGILFLINTIGGDVSAGLALAEMISSMSKPTVSLVLGDSHSIGVPLAVSTDYSFIAPSATMIIHPVRMNGTIIGAPQTFDYFKLIQERIVKFIATHSKVAQSRLEQMMINTGILTKDLGTILVGQQAVDEGLINQVGGISDAFAKLNELMDNKKNQ